MGHRLNEQTVAEEFATQTLAMKDRRLMKGLRSVALSLDPDVSEKADSFTLLQSIAAHCGLKLGDDGSVATCKKLNLQESSSLVR